jgi:hypothetical protein
MIPGFQLLVMLSMILSGAVLATAAYLIVRYIDKKKLKSGVVRSSLNTIILGSVCVVLIGFAFLCATIYTTNLHPVFLPLYLRPPYLKTFIELIILASSLRSFGAGNLPVVHLMDIGNANTSAPDANTVPGVHLRLLSRAKDRPTNFQMSKDLLYTKRKEFMKAGIKFAYPKRSIVLDKEEN